MINKINWVFFGTSEFSVYVLEELKIHKFVPNLIVASPDKPKGRKLTLTPPPTKVWAEENNIPIYQPQTLKSIKKDGTLVEEPAKNYLNNFLKDDKQIRQSHRKWDVFLVASYGKMIPTEIFDIPLHKTLNIHPSLLPKYRGASPIQAQILNDEKDVGVTLMQIDEGMDTGPIIIQKEIKFPSQQALKSTDIFLLKNSSCSAQSASQGISKPATSETSWPMGSQKLQKILAIKGAQLFAEILPDWLSNKIKPAPQDDNQATECGKIVKEDGELDLDLNNLEKNARQNLLKIKAFEEWPTAYFFLDTPKHSESNSRIKRVIITDATIENSSLKILRVIPEGKKEMSYEDFMRGQK